MPFTVVTLKNSPPSLRGDLTKWMQEISTGVYVGNFNTKVREELWKRIVESVGTGEATISFSYRNEIGYNFETHNSNRISIDYDGIPLVINPADKNEIDKDTKLGFSNASKIRKSKRYSKKILNNKLKPYVVLDLETTGLDYINDKIIEIGAIKVSDKIDEYSCIVKVDMLLPENIKNLTGMKDKDIQNGKDIKTALNELLDFIGNNTIIGYNIGFDIKFINEALKREGKQHITNQIYDVMQFVKKEKMFLKNYKLETVINEYDINEKVFHRALKDAKLIYILSNKLNELSKKLK